MEDWTPITHADFVILLAEQTASFEDSDKELWDKYSVKLRTVPIIRSAAYGLEQVFVVAALGNQVLFFDDVEDEFGVGRLPENGPLVDRGTYGELRSALRGLARHGTG